MTRGWDGGGGGEGGREDGEGVPEDDVSCLFCLYAVLLLLIPFVIPDHILIDYSLLLPPNSFLTNLLLIQFFLYI